MAKWDGGDVDAGADQGRWVPAVRVALMILFGLVLAVWISRCAEALPEEAFEGPVPVGKSLLHRADRALLPWYEGASKERPMPTTVSISIDVPDLARGVKFYCDAFGFKKKAAPVPGVVLLDGLNLELCLLEKPAGSAPSPHASDRRRYERHWSPVHLDIHVDDLHEALARAEAAGAKREQLFENPEHGSAASCSDPFGHGFCLLAGRGA